MLKFILFFGNFTIGPAPRLTGYADFIPSVSRALLNFIRFMVISGDLKRFYLKPFFLTVSRPGAPLAFYPFSLSFLKFSAAF